MMEISTQTSNSLTNEKSSDSLNEEDDLFYTSIKKDLDLIVKEPRSKTILSIIKYSKLL